EIIAAMYQNKLARMSTIDRTVELAVRNNVRVPGLAAWDEIARALQGAPPSSPEADALFVLAAESVETDDTQLVMGDGDQLLPEDELAGPEKKKETPIDKLTIPQKIRLATLGNGVARGVLIRDPVKIVAVAAIKAGGV